MNHSCNLPSFDVALSGLYSDTLDLINQSCQLDTGKKKQVYQVMSDQTPDSPFTVYNRQPDIHQNEAGIFKSLYEYAIESLTDLNSENSFEAEINEIPKPVLDKYVPWNSDDELINDELSSILNYPFTQQACLSVSEPDPIPARHLNPDNQLTHLPSVLFNRQDLPPVTLVNPINLTQTTSDKQTTPVEEIADNLPVEHQREKMQDPKKRNLINQHRRKKMQDPEKRKLVNQRRREKMQDPEKRKLVNQRRREKMQDPEKRKLINQRKRERRQDPEIRKLINQRQRERRKDPEKRKLENQRQRKRRQDPEKRNLINQRRRERYQEIVKDPAKRDLINQHQRERYRKIMKDPEKRNLKNQRQRERRQDPEKRKLINQRQRERRQDPKIESWKISDFLDQFAATARLHGCRS